ncbi:MAG: hypothetical protein IPF82_12625 [Blastocatellia bacterium]|nr:hypothetical protein [Blastocatellia bacterium]
MRSVSRHAPDHGLRSRLLIAASVVVALALVPAVARGQNAVAPSTTVSPLAGAATPAPLSDDERAFLLEQIRKLEQKVAELEAERRVAPASDAPTATQATSAVAPQQAGPAGSGAAPAPEAGKGDLAQQATDPTAALLSHTIKTTYSPSHWGIDDDANVVTFQSVIPFKAWGKVNLLRVNVPYTSTGPTSAGVGDVTVVDLMIFKKKAGTIGVGPLVNFRRNRNSDADTFEAGPAFVFIGTKGRLQFGIFNQNFFSTTTATSSLQPILAYQLGQGWSVSIGDQQILVDWKQPAFVSIPASVQFGKVTTLGGQPVRFFVNPQYNAKNTPGTTKWSVTFGFTILVPQGG